MHVTPPPTHTHTNACVQVSLDSGPPRLPPAFEAAYGTMMEYGSGGDEHGKLMWPQVWGGRGRGECV